MQTALELGLQQLADDHPRLTAAIAAADRGEVIDAEDVHAEVEALLQARGVTLEQLAVLRAEARAEAEALYGVSLCD